MFKGKRVSLIKTGIPETSKYPSASMKDYIPGEVHQGVSLPVNYTVTGVVITEPVVGLRLLIDRDSRNGVKVSGIFSSSNITKILSHSETSIQFNTENSTYLMELIDE